MAAIPQRVEVFADQGTVVEAPPEMYRSFWPEIRRGFYFRNRRDYLSFMRENHGRIFFFPLRNRLVPPFALVADWRSHSRTRTLWEVRAEGREREILVREASEICIAEGAERLVTRPLPEAEATEYESWGFEPFCEVVLLEKILCRESCPRLPERTRIRHFRRRDLEKVLELDALAFDDFWRLDRRTLARVSGSCLWNAFLVAECGDHLCGYAIGGGNGRLGYLQRLGVHPRFQGRGLGLSLATRLLSSLQAMGATLVSVNTQDDNLAALSLYHKLGFRETGEKRIILQRTNRKIPGSGK
ncbi:MAG: GNAT family N-acetyltransferase [Actinomycetota bacterium]